ncbi:MAG TPA: hypothetical protein VFL17_20415 [Anaerolineae bacterium]|nr:hypothetical protein [Anaerolineae bacterium]
MRVGLLVLMAALPLAACATPAVLGTVEPPIPTTALAPSIATVSTTVTPAAVTRAPTATPTPTRRPTATATLARITKTPPATPDIIGTLVATIQPRTYGTYLSPDGEWRAEVIIYDCARIFGEDVNAYEQLKLTQASTGAEKIVDSQLQYCGGVGAFGLAGLFWSPNSRYFYYTDARQGVPDGICSYWEPSSVSFDVVTGKTEYLGYGPRSPDGTKMAAWRDRELVIWDINAGEVGRVSVRAMGFVDGPIAWSPDSQALAYVRTTDYCPPRGKSYIGRVDLPGLRHTLLLESETPSFEGIQWDVLGQLRLFDEEGREWHYDFATEQLQPPF